MPTLLPSQYALISSFFAYLATFYIATPRVASPLRLATSREAISIVHCTLMTTLSAICLKMELPSTKLPSSRGDGRASHEPLPDYQLPIITTKSELANSVTAIETAYLLQDSLILLLASRRERAFLRGLSGTTSDVKAIKGLNFRHLGWHHAFLGSAFAVLQVYIARGKEKGILIIVAMLLMNASSIFGTLRWFLINLRPDHKAALRAATVAYLAAFATLRVFLLFYILATFGKQMDISALEAFRKLRLPCKLGMSSLGLMNTAWLINAVRSFVLRELSSRKKAN